MADEEEDLHGRAMAKRTEDLQKQYGTASQTPFSIDAGVRTGLGLSEGSDAMTPIGYREGFKTKPGEVRSSPGWVNEAERKKTKELVESQGGEYHGPSSGLVRELKEGASPTASGIEGFLSHPRTEMLMQGPALSFRRAAAIPQGLGRLGAELMNPKSKEHAGERTWGEFGRTIGDTATGIGQDIAAIPTGMASLAHGLAGEVEENVLGNKGYAQAHYDAMRRINQQYGGKSNVGANFGQGMEAGALAFDPEASAKERALGALGLGAGLLASSGKMTKPQATTQGQYLPPTKAERVLGALGLEQPKRFARNGQEYAPPTRTERFFNPIGSAAQDVAAGAERFEPLWQGETGGGPVPPGMRGRPRVGGILLPGGRRGRPRKEDVLSEEQLKERIHDASNQKRFSKEYEAALRGEESSQQTTTPTDFLKSITGQEPGTVSGADINALDEILKHAKPGREPKYSGPAKPSAPQIVRDEAPTPQDIALEQYRAAKAAKRSTKPLNPMDVLTGKEPSNAAVTGERPANDLNQHLGNDARGASAEPSGGGVDAGGREIPAKENPQGAGAQGQANGVGAEPGALRGDAEAGGGGLRGGNLTESGDVREHSQRTLGQPFTDEDLHWMVGSPHANVDLNPVGDGYVANFKIGNSEHHVMVEGSRQPDGTIRPQIRNYISKANNEPGVMQAMMRQQKEAAETMGARLLATGDRNDAAGINGYRALPAAGFDGPIPDSVRVKLPPEFQGAKTVQDIWQAKGGKRWWTEHGDSFDGEFDPAASRNAASAGQERPVPASEANQPSPQGGVQTPGGGPEPVAAGATNGAPEAPAARESPTTLTPQSAGTAPASTAPPPSGSMPMNAPEAQAAGTAPGQPSRELPPQGQEAPPRSGQTTQGRPQPPLQEPTTGGEARGSGPPSVSSPSNPPPKKVPPPPGGSPPADPRAQGVQLRKSPSRPIDHIIDGGGNRDINERAVLGDHGLREYENLAFSLRAKFMRLLEPALAAVLPNSGMEHLGGVLRTITRRFGGSPTRKEQAFNELLGHTEIAPGVWVDNFTHNVEGRAAIGNVAIPRMQTPEARQLVNLTKQMVDATGKEVEGLGTWQPAMKTLPNGAQVRSARPFQAKGDMPHPRLTPKANQELSTIMEDPATGRVKLTPRQEIIFRGIRASNPGDAISPEGFKAELGGQAPLDRSGPMEHGRQIKVLPSRIDMGNGEILQFTKDNPLAVGEDVGRIRSLASGTANDIARLRTQGQKLDGIDPMEWSNLEQQYGIPRPKYWPEQHLYEMGANGAPEESLDSYRLSLARIQGLNTYAKQNGSIASTKIIGNGLHEMIMHSIGSGLKALAGKAIYALEATGIPYLLSGLWAAQLVQPAQQGILGMSGGFGSRLGKLARGYTEMPRFLARELPLVGHVGKALLAPSRAEEAARAMGLINDGLTSWAPDAINQLDRIRTYSGMMGKAFGHATAQKVFADMNSVIQTAMADADFADVFNRLKTNPVQAPARSGRFNGWSGEDWLKYRVEHGYTDSFMKQLPELAAREAAGTPLPGDKALKLDLMDQNRLLSTTRFQFTPKSVLETSWATGGNDKAAAMSPLLFMDFKLKAFERTFVDGFNEHYQIQGALRKGLITQDEANAAYFKRLETTVSRVAGATAASAMIIMAKDYLYSHDVDKRTWGGYLARLGDEVGILGPLEIARKAAFDHGAMPGAKFAYHMATLQMEEAIRDTPMGKMLLGPKPTTHAGHHQEEDLADRIGKKYGLGKKAGGEDMADRIAKKYGIGHNEEDLADKIARKYGVK